MKRVLNITKIQRLRYAASYALAALTMLYRVVFGYKKYKKSRAIWLSLSKTHFNNVVKELKTIVYAN